MFIQVYVEINAFGLLVLFMMLFSIKRNLTVQFGEKLFIALIFSFAAILIIDAFSWLLNGSKIENMRFVLIALNTAYYFFFGVIGFLWLLYSDYRIYSDSIKLRKRATWYAIACGAVCVLSIINIFTGCIFYIDSENMYTRGSSFIPLTAVIWLVMLIPAAMAVQQAAHEPLRYKRREYIIESLYVLPPLIGWVIQYVFDLAPIMWILAVSSLLFNFFEIQGRQISIDALTGVNNRRTFNKYLETIAENQRQKGSLTLFLIDVNNFKLINDTYGHIAGDDALVSFAKVLKKVCGRRNCFLARYGGDEFAVICFKTDEKQLAEIISEINYEVDLENKKSNREYLLSCSIGRSSFNCFCVSEIDNIVTQADRDMYRNKSHYKNEKPNWRKNIG